MPSITAPHQQQSLGSDHRPRRVAAIEVPLFPTSPPFATDDPNPRSPPPCGRREAPDSPIDILKNGYRTLLVRLFILRDLRKRHRFRCSRRTVRGPFLDTQPSREQTIP